MFLASESFDLYADYNALKVRYPGLFNTYVGNIFSPGRYGGKACAISWPSSDATGLVIPIPKVIKMSDDQTIHISMNSYLHATGALQAATAKTFLCMGRERSTHEDVLDYWGLVHSTGGVSPSPRVQLKRNVGYGETSDVLAECANPFVVNTWQHVEFAIKVNAGGDGRFTLWVNGVERIHYEGPMVSAAWAAAASTWYINAISFREMYDHTWVVDDIVIWDEDATDGFSMPYLGPHQVKTLSPASVGTKDQYSVNTGTKVAALIANDGDTTYLGNALSSRSQTFNFDDLTLSAGQSVIALVETIRVRSETSGGKVNIVAKDPNSDLICEDRYDRSLATSYGYTSRPLIRNPVSGAEWTAAAINDLEYGFKSVTVRVTYTQPDASGSAYDITGKPWWYLGQAMYSNSVPTAVYMVNSPPFMPSYYFEIRPDVTEHSAASPLNWSGNKYPTGACEWAPLRFTNDYWYELRNALTNGQAFSFVNNVMNSSCTLICRWNVEDYKAIWDTMQRFERRTFKWTIQVWQGGAWVDIGSPIHRYGDPYFGQSLPLLVTQLNVPIKRYPYGWFNYRAPQDPAQYPGAASDDWLAIGQSISINPNTYSVLISEIDISGPPFYYPYKLGLIPSGIMFQGYGARYPTLFSSPFVVFYGGQWCHQSILPYDALPPSPFGTGPNRGAGGGAVVTVEVESAIPAQRVSHFYIDAIVTPSLFGTISVTEEPDTCSFTGATGTAVNTFSVTEEPDTCQFAGTIVQPPKRRAIVMMKGKS